MSSDQTARWRWAEAGYDGPRAQLREYERQLRWLSKWVAMRKRTAARKRRVLKAKIAKLRGAKLEE